MTSSVGRTQRGDYNSVDDLANLSTTRRSLRLFVVAIAMLTLVLASSIIFQPPGNAVVPTGTYFDHVVIIVMAYMLNQDICHRSPPPCLTSGPSGSAPY